jgi:hypothetical protein
MFDGEADPATAAAQALATLSRLGRRPRRENVPIEDDRAAAAFLTERMVTVFAEQVPLWQRLGVL